MRTLNPLDEQAIFDLAKKHGKILVVTEESKECSFALSLIGRIQTACFSCLDAPIGLVGSIDTPAIPLNAALEAEILPNAAKINLALNSLFTY